MKHFWIHIIALSSFCDGVFSWNQDFPPPARNRLPVGTTEQSYVTTTISTRREMFWSAMTVASGGLVIAGASSAVLAEEVSEAITTLPPVELVASGDTKKVGKPPLQSSRVS